MTRNKVVARYQDGRVLKGFTLDFAPSRPTFHVSPADAARADKPIEVSLSELKAVFFVKDFIGNSQYNDRREFDPSDGPKGRRISVRFKDAEVLVGTTQGYDRSRPGFFIVPADSQSNIERCYVVSAAIAEVTFG